MSESHCDTAELPRPVLEPGWTNRYTSPRIPYVESGRDLSGFDCWGLLRHVYREEFGILLPSLLEFYESADDAEGIHRATSFHECDWRKVRRPAEGDGMWLKLAGHPCHVGIYVGAGLMLHSRPGIGTGIERITQAWSRRVKAYYRHCEMPGH